MEFKLIFYTIVLAAYIMFFTFLSPLNKKGDNILGLLFIIFGGFFTLTGFKVILDLYQSNSTFDGSSVIKNILKEDNLIGKVYKNPITYIAFIFGFFLSAYLYFKGSMDEKALITFIILFVAFIGSYSIEAKNIPNYLIFGIPIVMIFISLCLILNMVVKKYYYDKRNKSKYIQEKRNRREDILKSDDIYFRIFYDFKDNLSSRTKQYIDEYRHFLVASISLLISSLSFNILSKDINELLTGINVNELNLQYFNFFLLFGTYFTSSYTLGTSVTIHNITKRIFDPNRQKTIE